MNPAGGLEPLSWKSNGTALSLPYKFEKNNEGEERLAEE
jgi:hypothetical protein